MSVNSCRSWLCIAVSVAALTSWAFADVLLVVDLSVPNQVTINATGGLSANSASSGDTIGVYFENFYGGAGSTLAESLVSGNLTSAANASDGTPDLFRGGSGSDPGLNFWSWTNDATSTFTAGSLAFAGSATWNLTPTQYAEMLAGSSSGNLYFPADTFDDVPNATYLGTYTVSVPEPGALSLLGLSFLALRRHRR